MSEENKNNDLKESDLNNLQKLNEELPSNNNDNINNNNSSLNNKNSKNNISFNSNNSKSNKEKKEEKLKYHKKFDILMINTQLNKLNENEVYIDNNNNIFMYNNKEKNQEKYYASITLNEGLSEFKYIGGLGIFDTNLKRQGFGYIEYEKDKYIGNWEQDLKNGFGIYGYEKNEKNINKNSDINDFYTEEIYIGNWENDLKKGKGIYIFKKHKEEDISEGDYDFLFGNFEDDKFQYGYIISKKDNSKIIYKGKINENGEKNDEESFYFENFNNDIKNDNNINNKSTEEIDNEKKGFFGEFKNNIMNKGRIIIFDENDEENKTYYFEKINNNDKINNNSEIIVDNKIEEEIDSKKLSEKNDDKDEYIFDIEKENDKNEKIKKENEFIIDKKLNKDDIISDSFQFYINIFKDLDIKSIKEKQNYFEENIQKLLEINIDNDK